MTVDDDRTAAPAAGPARKTATRKTAARKAPAKKAPAKKAAAKKSPAKNAAAKKAPAQRAPQKAAATKAPAKKAAPKAVEQPGTTTPEDPPSAVAPVDDPSDGTTPDLTAADPAQTAPRPRSIVTVAVSALTAAALVFAVVAAVVWWRADHDAARHRGLTRDRALLAARVGIQTVSTSDYRHPGATLDAWLSVSTGTLAEQFNQSRASATKLLGEAKVITTATVLDAAVVTLNVGKGTATVIASVNLRKQPASGAAATSRNRLRASLTRVKGRWKISDLQVVSVRLS